MYVKLGATVRGVIGVSTFSDGSAVDADTTPTVVVLDQGSPMVYTPTAAHVDTGLYEVPIVATSGNGFTDGHEYTCYVVVVVGGKTVRAPLPGASAFTVQAVSLDDLALSSDVATLLTRLSSARAGYLDNLSAGAVAQASTLATDLAAIEALLPSALVGGRMDCNVSKWASAAVATPNVAGVPVVDTEYESGTVQATPTVAGVPKVEEATLESRLTATRAGYLDNLSAGAVAQAATALSTAQWTNARAGYLDNLSAGAVALESDLMTGLGYLSTLLGEVALGSDMATALSDLSTLLTRLSSTRAGYLDNLSAGAVALAATALSTAQWTNARAGYLDNLSAGAAALESDLTTLLSRLSAARAGYLDNLSAGAVALESDLTAGVAAIEALLPAALVGGKMDSSVSALADDTITAASIDSDALAAIADAIFAYVIESGPSNATTFLQRTRVLWSILMAKANGLAIGSNGVEHFRDAADSKDRATFTLDTDGTRVPGSFDGT